jgi:hypothetical protein
MRQAIPSKLKLEVTLPYLSTGNHFTSLEFFGSGKEPSANSYQTLAQLSGRVYKGK